MLDRLNAGLAAKVTLVTAPPGFGKTSLVSTWVTSTEVPAGWLSLDRRDNDPAQFFSHFIAALQRFHPSLGGQILAELSAAQSFSVETLLTDLINEIAALPGQYVLVLDDFHLVENQAIHAGMTFLLEHLPGQLHLVFATRSDPPLPLPRFRARGEINELRVEDLRFGLEETNAFLHAAVGDTLTQSEITALKTRTEGWVAGLQLAVLSMKAHHEQSSFIQNFTGSNRYIIDYLVEEVLNQLPDAVRQFLLQTSILDRFCAELCDAILIHDAHQQGLIVSVEMTDAPGSSISSQQILDLLERNNIFLLPLDSRRQWYRYHHLFADILRHFLNNQQGSMIPSLHRRASIWFASKDLVDEAIDHACAARDWRLAADHISHNSRKVLLHGEFSRLTGWVNRLPMEYRQGDPELSVYYCWSLLFSGKIDDAESAFRSVEDQLAASAEPFLSMSRKILRAFIDYHHGRGLEALPLLNEAIERLDYEDPSPDDQLLYGFARAGLADTYRVLGKLELAEEAYAEAIPINQRVGNILAVLVCYRNLGDLLFEHAQLQKAVDVYQEAIEQSRSWAKDMFGEAYDLLPSADHFARRAEIHYERNELEDAARMIGKAIPLLELSGSTHLSNAYYQQGRVALANKDFFAAHTQIQKLRQASAKISTRYPFAQSERYLTDLRIQIASWQLPPDFPVTISSLRNEIEDWAFSFERGHPGKIPYLYDIQAVVLGRAYLFLGQPDKAVALLTPLQETARASGRRRSLLERLTVLARGHQALGDSASALTAIGEALAIAESHGFLRTVLDAGQEIRPLLQSALRHNITPRFTAYLLELLSGPAMEDRPQTRANLLLIEPLSERELEILSLVADGLSNQQIAENLFIALSTVKKHMSAVLGKLNVESRTEAIQRARTLGLI